MGRVRVQGMGAPPEVLASVRRGLAEADVEVASASGERAGVEVLVFGDDEAAALEVLRFAGRDPLSRVVVLGGDARLSVPGVAWRLRAAGAADVLVGDDAQMAAAVASRLRRWAEVDALVAACETERGIIGRSAKWIAMLRELVEVAAFTTSSVVLIGESGTGKEQLAALIHALAPAQKSGPGECKLVTLDCTTVVPELSGSEFFGHERGAFTGATGTRDGAFAQADGGTLFLDEVGELPLGLQAQLLRVIQEGTYKRVGGNEWLDTQFRLVCATHVDLPREVGERRFRLDFYHRIGGWVVRVPPLRERVDDIVRLVRHFVARRRPAADVTLTPPVQQLLMERGYPGNVRELKALVERLCARHVGGGPFTVGDLGAMDLDFEDQPAVACDRSLEEAAARAALAGVGLREIGRVAREAAIRSALAASEESVQSASRLLKVTDRALQLELAKRDN